MDVSAWLPLYDEISRDLSLDPREDAAAGRMLAAMIASNSRISSMEDVMMELHRLIEDRDVYILGAGPDLEDELSILVSEKQSSGAWTGLSTGKDVLITADGATSALMRSGYVPEIIVTDLDGGIEDQVQCLSRGSVFLVHSHGDNVNKLRSTVPRLFGSVMGTTQVNPYDAGGMQNFGGFTDGDRAAFTADHFGARSIVLLGFDFNEVGTKLTDGGIRSPVLSPEEERFKFKKLAWANILLGLIGPPEVKFFSDRNPF